MMKLKLKFFVCLQVNRVFHACIHDTNIIPECQSKHKLIKIILSLIVGVKYEIYLTPTIYLSIYL